MADESISVVEFLRSFRNDVKEEFNEINAKLNSFVLREVYLADKAANEARLARLEQESQHIKQEKRQDRSLVRGAIYTSAGGLVVGLTLAIVTVLFGMK